MKNLYRTIDHKSFKFYSFCIALLGDGMLFTYLYRKFTDQELFLKILKEAWKTKNIAGAPSVSFANELFAIWDRSLLLMLILVGIFHLLIYILWQLNKKPAVKYSSLYFKVAMIGFPLMGLVLIMSAPIWGLIFILLGLAYFFVLGGMKYYDSK